MKKIFALVIGFVVFALVTNAQQPKKFRDIIGKWQIAGEQDAGATLEIIDSTTIIMTYMGEQKKITDYKFDFTKTPIWFDFQTQDSSSVVQVRTLLEVVNESMIKWQLFVDEERTPHFSSTKGELFYLTKARATPAVTAKQE